MDYGAANSDFSEEFMENLGKYKTINIDHHETNSFYGTWNYVDKEAPSCCSVLVNMFKKVGIEFDKVVSLSLMLGICTDTAFFIHGICSLFN